MEPSKSEDGLDNVASRNLASHDVVVVELFFGLRQGKASTVKIGGVSCSGRERGTTGMFWAGPKPTLDKWG